MAHHHLDTRRSPMAQSRTLCIGMEVHKETRLLLDARVVDVPMAYNPIVVTPPSWNIFCVNGLQNALRFSDAVGGEAPRNPLRACDGRTELACHDGGPRVAARRLPSSAPARKVPTCRSDRQRAALASCALCHPSAVTT